jgi:hypothetical protein
VNDAAKPSHRTRHIIIVVTAVLVLLVVGVVALGLSLSGDDQEAGLAALEGTSVDESTLPVTVPFSLVAGHIVVDATFADSDEPVELIFDSGAPMILSAELADAFGGDVAGHLSTAAIDGTVSREDVVTVPELRLGDATFTEVGATNQFLEPDNPLSCISSNGLIGASLMKEAVWQIDYGTQEITIASSVDGMDHIEGATALAFSSPFSASPSPQLPLVAGEGTLNFLIDTGSDGSLTLNPADLAGIGSELDPSAPAIELVGAGAAGTYDARVTYAGVDLGLGDHEFDAFPVATTGTLQAALGNIGTAFLSHYVVTIDWPQSTIYFDQVSDDARPPAPQAARINWDGERVTVGSVVEGSAVAQGGLEVGQPISSVYGQDVSSATRDDFCEIFIAEQPDDFELTLDDGQTFQIGLVEDFYDPLSEG